MCGKLLIQIPGSRHVPPQNVRGMGEEYTVILLK